MSYEMNVDTLGDEIFFTVKRELDVRSIKYIEIDIQHFCYEAAECIVESLENK